MTELTSRLVRKLEHYEKLPAEEKKALELAASGVLRVRQRDTLTKQGSPVDRIFAIVEGFACRYCLLPDGRRQISAFLLPGDMCDTRMFALARMDHSICALSPVEALQYSAESVRRLEQLPVLSRVLARSSIAQQSIAREWLLNVGHRTAFERLCHFFCEIFERLQAVDLVRDYSCELPLTQVEIADTLALTSVHVNRTLMELRRSQLVTFQNKQLVIHDYAALRRVAGFDPAYLHLEDPGAMEPRPPHQPSGFARLPFNALGQ
jgi:CRP-like cAMP-binding protein